MAGMIGKTSIFLGEVNERTVQKWRMIQIATFLPLIIYIICLFEFRGSILGTIVFFMLLIVGIIIPQVYRDMIHSHLILKKEIEGIKKS